MAWIQKSGRKAEQFIYIIIYNPHILLSMRWYEKDNVKKIILLTGVTLVVYLSMRYVLPIVIPFLLGAALAMMLNQIGRAHV